jgi:calcineurin-like phosphoesterase family protein
MRPAKTWIVTDTHFNHKAMVLNGWRPADYEARLMKNWSHLVAEQDKVIHLGDVIIGMNGTLKDLLDCLPGRKYLVRGNHDHESDDWYMSHGFDFACQGLVYGGVYFSHAPSFTLPFGTDLNVHGHLHDMKHRGDNIPAHCKLLSMEFTDYCPVLFDEFVGRPPSRKVALGDYF